MEWKTIKDYKDYEINTNGDVMRGSRLLKHKKEKNGYSRVTLFLNGKPRLFSVHRLLLQTFNPIDVYMEVDHINHNPSDNRLENLRWCSSSQNKRNVQKPIGCSSKYIGVYKRGKKWHCSVRINGKKKFCGSFNTEEEAGKRYNDVIIEHNLQDFAVLNVFENYLKKQLENSFGTLGENIVIENEDL
jgi:hypothetical protein